MQTVIIVLRGGCVGKREIDLRLRRFKLFRTIFLILAGVINVTLLSISCIRYGIRSQNDGDLPPWARLVYFILAVVEFVVFDFVIIFYFLRTATFVISLRNKSPRRGVKAAFTCREWAVLSMVFYVFLSEVYYSVSFTFHRFMMLLDVEATLPYKYFRDFNTEIFDKFKVFTTGLATLFLFNHLVKKSSKVTEHDKKLTFSMLQGEGGISNVNQNTGSRSQKTYIKTTEVNPSIIEDSADFG